MAESGHEAKPRVLSINIGGITYSTKPETIARFPDSNLAQLINDDKRIPEDEHNQTFIDRDGSLFRYVLNFLRSSELKLPLNFQDYEQLVCEAEYYGLPELQEAVLQQYLLKKKRNESIIVSLCYFHKNSFRPLDMTNIFFNSSVKDNLQGPCALVQGKAEVLMETLGELCQDLPVDLDDTANDFLSHVLYQHKTKYFTHVYVPLGHLGVEDKEFEIGSAASPGIVWTNNTVNRMRAFSEIKDFSMSAEKDSQRVHYQGDSRSGAGWKMRIGQLEDINRLCFAGLIDLC